jgi:ATP-dependent DNA helicase RecG
MTYPLLHPRSRSTTPLLLDAEGFRTEFPGESRHVEFKQGVSADRIARAVTAFSNTDGGVLLVGVSPAGAAVGTNADGESLARLHRIVASVHDGGRYELLPLTVGDRTVVGISVARREQGFAQTADGQVVVRRDAMNVALIGADLADFIRRNALTRFEATATDAVLDPALLARVREAFAWTVADDERLIEHGLASRTGRDARLTVAGTLYLVQDPHRVLGKSYIEVFRYRDDTTTTEDKRYRITGPVPEQVTEATARIADEIGHDVVVLGVHRYELPRIPLAVLREAVANAVAHRVYEDNRRCVRIEIRPGRVTVTSPGPLPEPVTIANMREQNAARNVDLIAALRRFRLAEDAGRGVDLMQDTMAEHLLDPPVFTADAASVTVDLPLTSTVTTAERAWVSEIESRGRLQARDRVLLVHAARGEALTNTSARELLGVDSTHARGALQRLRDAGLLQQSGERSGARYTLADTIAAPAGLRLGRTDLHSAVVTLADETPVTNRLVRERFAVDRVEALRILSALVEDGRLVRLGERRGVRYMRP